MSSALRDWEGKPAVYRYTDKAGRLLYIGSTKNIVRRDAEHRSGGTGAFWYPAVAKVRVKVFSTMEAARAAEIVAIQEEEPAFNNKATGRKPGSRETWTLADHRLYRLWRKRERNCVGWWRTA